MATHIASVKCIVSSDPASLSVQPDGAAKFNFAAGVRLDLGNSVPITFGPGGLVIKDTEFSFELRNAAGRQLTALIVWKDQKPGNLCKPPVLKGLTATVESIIE
jgi:hypothetical protein